MKKFAEMNIEEKVWTAGFVKECVDNGIDPRGSIPLSDSDIYAIDEFVGRAESAKSAQLPGSDEEVGNVYSPSDMGLPAPAAQTGQDEYEENPDVNTDLMQGLVAGGMQADPDVMEDVNSGIPGLPGTADPNADQYDGME